MLSRLEKERKVSEAAEFFIEKYEQYLKHLEEMLECEPYEMSGSEKTLNQDHYENHLLFMKSFQSGISLIHETGFTNVYNRISHRVEASYSKALKLKRLFERKFPSLVDENHLWYVV